ncbi:MAG: hypothetical protein IJH32_10715 [Ruminococcus sp.]|nr:hypothetical protein [Ruminococcus sp.]
MENKSYQVNEKDWKLFRKLLPGWQEAYMEKLIEEYKELLNNDERASEKYWVLEKKVNKDKYNSGVLYRGYKCKRRRRDDVCHYIFNSCYRDTVSAAERSRGDAVDRCGGVYLRHNHYHRFLLPDITVDHGVQPSSVCAVLPLQEGLSEKSACEKAKKKNGCRRSKTIFKKECGSC